MPAEKAKSEFEQWPWRGVGVHSAPMPYTPASEINYSAPADAALLRALLIRAGFGQHTAARELNIDEQVMVCYCAGSEPVPRVVMLAVERLVDRRKELLAT
jgi:hypothetical protein